MDRPQDIEGTMGGTRTSALAQASLSDSTSASRGLTTTNTSPSQSSYLSFLGESHDIIVPPDARILRPRSLEDINNVIEELKAEFDQHTLDADTPTLSQYIWVHEIPQYLFAQIETDLKLFPGVRVTVAYAESSVLLKVMPGRQYERIISNFSTIILGYLNSMGLALQNGDFTGQNAERTPGVVSSKEPDWAFGPYDARVDSAADEYPSLVLEVGASESLSQLRQDVRWWYANTNQETQLVILINITDNPYRVDFEVWTEVANQSTVQSTRSRPATVLECTQSASLQNGVVIGAPLILDFATLMHRSPRVGEHNISLGAADLGLIGARRRPAPRTVLVANRGEIALRIIRTLREMKISSVAIYSSADARAPHVTAADVALPLPGNTVSDTYLNGKHILDMAIKADADAVIPGYGLLSENADFAAAVEAAGLVWIGPTPKQMRDLGLKHRARDIAITAGTPVLPGSEGLVTSVEDALAEAEKIGYPVMVKSTAGGGGIGLQRCADIDSLREAFDGVRRLGQANFGDDGGFIEHFIDRGRHIEVQVLGDGTGRVICAGERDCSLQRRNQKVVEESPAGFVQVKVRAMRRAAAALVRIFWKVI
ncbi:hypothetical protein ACN42_g4045 [Penicillium freii]|uniref:ATP-grasp domain-containing protein n=1 Tax=Penicillium freii TaxID=48697 RepID=A0A101MM57_PENFR|nr:hypothetical protein ACN42_g4045 [Penicillium freii]